VADAQHEQPAGDFSERSVQFRRCRRGRVGHRGVRPSGQFTIERRSEKGDRHPALVAFS
jgi:hypothetical protein